jgi:predicted dinucleotide-binding enzyme
MKRILTGPSSPQRFEESRPLPRIAVLGAGHSGPVIARAAVEAGYHVSIAASGDPQRIDLISRVLAPGAEPRWAADAVVDADVVVLAIPIHRFAAFDPALVAGKLVVDVMNYWPPVDGVQAIFEDRRRGSSEIVQDRLAESTVVKTLNHLGYHQLDEERRTRGVARTACSRCRRRRPGRRGRCRGHHREDRLRHRTAGQPPGGSTLRSRRPGVRGVVAPT